MIFEILISKDVKILDLYDTLMSLGDFAIDNGVIYLDTIKDISKVSQKLPIEKVRNITNSNYSNIGNALCRKWCQDKLYMYELLDFEKTPECQERLRYIHQQLDILEKGGEMIAKKEKSKSAPHH